MAMEKSASRAAHDGADAPTGQALRGNKGPIAKEALDRWDDEGGAPAKLPPEVR